MSNSEKSYVIVVGIDYSPASDLALERAFELARARPRAEVHIVNVVNLYGAHAVLDGSAEPAVFAKVTLADATAQLERHVAQRRAAFAASLESVNVRAHLRLEAPAHEIARSPPTWRPIWWSWVPTAGEALLACSWVRWLNRSRAWRHAPCSWCDRKSFPSPLLDRAAMPAMPGGTAGFGGCRVSV